MSPHRTSVHEAGHVLAFAPLAALALNDFSFVAEVFPSFSLKHVTTGYAGRVQHTPLECAFEKSEDYDLCFLVMMAAGCAGERLARGKYRLWPQTLPESDRSHFEEYASMVGIDLPWDDAVDIAEVFLRSRRDVLSDLSWRLDERTPLTKDEAFVYWLRCKHEAR